MRERKIEKYLIKSPKQMIMIITLFTLIFFVGGTTYAFFNYTRIGSADTISTGRISFNHTQGNTINLTNVFPISSEEAETDTDNSASVSIAVTGDTDYDGGMEYVVTLDGVSNTINNKKVPINLDISVTGTGLGTEETGDYYTNRDSYTTSKYKKEYNGKLEDGKHILVGYIAPNVTKGTASGINGTINIKAYIDSSKVLISDTYNDGNPPTDEKGTPIELGDGKTVFTTSEWSNVELSFKIKVEAREDIWVEGPMTAYDIIKKNVDRTTQINFGNISSDTNGKGVYEIKDDNNNSIYYYRGAVSNNNVVFGDFCWQMVRTTDTGGVKMIYNGVATDDGNGQYTCENTTGASRQLASTKAFNTSYSSMSDVGYMYSKRYPYQQKNTSEIVFSSTSLNTTYWYSDMVTWGSPTASKYNLDNPYQVSSTTDYPSLVGKYTFINTSQTYTNTSVYYIAAVNNTTMYCIQLTNTGNHTLADFNYTYTYGDGYTDLGNGTYEITDTTSVTTINRSDWYTNYSNLTNKYVCKNATNNTCSEVRYVTSTSNTSMTYLKVSNIKFSSGISNYDSTTSTYTLDNDNSVSFWDITNSTNKTSLNNHHYTCWNESETCTTLSYIYYLSGTTYYYINLTGGELVEDALYKMTGNATDEVKNREINQNYELNTTDSAIKTYIESWFKTNLTNEEDATKINYQEYLEDTIYCNDRSYQQSGSNTLALSGWNPNGGSVTTDIYFNTRTRWYNSSWYSTTNKPTFACPNDTDSFTVNSQNGNGKLNYPVGLLTVDEIILAGASGNSSTTNNSYYLYTGNFYWGLSPSYFNNLNAYGFSVRSAGSLYYYYVGYSIGARPSVSLKPGTEFVDGGEGTTAKPYVVKYTVE